MTTVYRVNRPQVICEVLDDELVAVDWETGNYFGMSGSALAIWRLIDRGVGVEDASRWLAAAHGQDEQSTGQAVRAFVAELQRHHLIVPTTGADAVAPPDPPPDIPCRWEPPTLSVYEDMQDLLLLDPIHDVDDTGWPTRKPDGGEP